MTLFIIVSICVVILDQLSKLAVIKTIAEDEIVPVIDKVIHFTHIKNEGAAFGIFSEHRWVFIVVSLIAVVAITYYVVRTRPQGKFYRFGLGFVVGGGIANLIDRIAFGKVTDFIDLEFLHFTVFGKNFDFAVFNIADCFVTVGCIMIIIHVIGKEINERKQRRSLE